MQNHYGEILNKKNNYKIIDCKICKFIHILPLPSEKKGISITLIYQDPNRTLVEEEATRYDKTILSHLQNKFGVKLRD